MEGDPKVDNLMRPVRAAIERNVKNQDAVTEIYNRAYEAVMNGMREYQMTQLQDVQQNWLSSAEWESLCAAYDDLQKQRNNSRSRADWMREAKRLADEKDLLLSAKEINDILQAEITWCLEHPDQILSANTQHGFIDGLRQAQILLRLARVRKTVEQEVRHG